MNPNDRPKNGQRIDTSDEANRWLIMLFGLLIVGMGIGFSFAEIGEGGSRWFLLLFFAGGVFVIWLGARYRRAYFTTEGLLRKGWTGSEVVPWSRVATIEFDEIPAQGGAVGWVRLRLEHGRKVSIRVAPGRVSSRGRWIARVCPQAAIDDRRTGEVTAPRAGSADRIAQQEAEARSRAARSHRAIAILWAIAGVVCVAAIVIAAMLTLRKNPVETVVLMLGCALAAYVAIVKMCERIVRSRDARRT